MKLEWVEPSKIREHWELIKPGLKKIEKLSNEWIAEELYMSLCLEQCSLHIVRVGGEYIGFTITQKQQKYGQVNLHLWACYSNANDFNLLEEAQSHFMEWAKNINAKKITFGSPRKGWSKVAEKLGYKASPVITYEKEVKL